MPQKCRARLEGYADRVLEMPPCADIPDATATHPDMLGYVCCGTLFVGGGYYRDNRAFFDALGCDVEVCDVRYGKYPRDVYFNVFELGGKLYGLCDVTPDEIKSRYAETVRVKQGYAKCSSVVMDGAVVTADLGIAEAVRANGGDALTVRTGHVRLRGYEYGFIGGAVMSPSRGVLVCAGDLRTHPDAPEIIGFAARCGYTFDNIHDMDPLVDCGGILTITF